MGDISVVFYYYGDIVIHERDIMSTDWGSLVLLRYIVFHRIKRDPHSTEHPPWWYS